MDHGNLPLKREHAFFSSLRATNHRKPLHQICRPVSQYEILNTYKTRSLLYLNPLLVLLDPVLTIVLQLLLRADLGKLVEGVRQGEQIRKMTMMVMAKSRWGAACLLLDSSKALVGEEGPALAWMVGGGP